MLITYRVRTASAMALLLGAACGGSTSDSPVITGPAAVTSLDITPASLTLVPGQSTPLIAVARDASGKAVGTATVTWSSSSAAVASVAASGTVAALAPGSSTITAASGTASATVVVSVGDGGYITAAGGVISGLGGALRLEVPAGAVSSATAFTVRQLASPLANARLLTASVVVIEPTVTFSSPSTLSLRYPSPLGATVVETQLRLAHLTGAAWQESPVRPVDRANRLASATVSSTGTWAIFVPPPSLRGFAQTRPIEIGAAVSAGALRSDTAYARLLAAEYGSVTPENAMKFGVIHPAQGSYAFADADTIVGFAAANGMKVHGHVLLWHSQQPAWLTNGTPTRASLLAALKEHIETVVGRYAGKTVSWDVANEMISDTQTGLRASFWTTIVGPDVIDSAFTWAHRKDPAAKLYLNDYSVEVINPKSDSLFALVTRLKARGIPIDGVGLQAHFEVPSPSTVQLAANLSRFAAAGFDIRFTELDVRIADGSDALTTQGTAYANTVAACLSEPRCKAVTTWGFTDRYSWIPGAFTGFGRALPFDQNFAIKPAYTSLFDALSRP